MSIFNLTNHHHSNSQEPIAKEWPGREFRTRGGAYLDRSKRPLFNTKNSIYHLREEVSAVIEQARASTPHEKVMMPFGESLASFWTNCVGEGAMNQSYSPFAVFYYVLRDHTKELISICDGRVIEDLNDYNRLVMQFNNTFYRVLEGRGSGTIRGYCSEDEMIRMGTLFYLLMVSCDQSEGLVLNEDRCFANKWGGKKVTVDFDSKAMDQYKSKLKGVVMSDMYWRQFMFRYLDKTDEDTLWMINVPPFSESDRDESVHQWLTKEHFIDLVDMLPLITDRKGDIVMVVRNTKGFIKSCANLFDFVLIGKGRWKNSRGLYLTEGFETVGQKYSIFTSYSI